MNSYLSLGGGLQSSTIVEMMVEGELSPVDLVLFADTGDEPDYVYSQVGYLKGRLQLINVPLEIVSIGDMIKHYHEPWRRFATLPVFTKLGDNIGKMPRHCTHDYKINPIEKRVRRGLLELGKATEQSNGAIRINKGVQIECWLGISLDEVQRMKENKHKWVFNRWPLIEKRMTRLDCSNWLSQRGLPVPRKSSCRICPYHNDDHFRWMKDYRPDDWKHVVEFDDFLRNGNGKITTSARGELFLHKSCVPMSEVDLSNQQDKGQLEMFDVCDEGYCFI